MAMELVMAKDHAVRLAFQSIGRVASLISELKPIEQPTAEGDEDKHDAEIARQRIAEVASGRLIEGDALRERLAQLEDE